VADPSRYASEGAAGITAAEVATLQRRVLLVTVGAQLLAGAGLAAGITVGALLAEDVLGSTGWAGIPAALFTAGSAVAATVQGRLSQAYGRRVGLAVGYGAGAVGSVGIVLGAVTEQPILLLAAMTVYGSGAAANLQARYAGADLAPPDGRGRAVSTILVATTVGAVAGPNLVAWTGRLAADVGLPVLAGPFVLAAFAYAAAALVLAGLLRPDPLLVARRIASTPVETRSPVADEPATGDPAVGDTADRDAAVTAVGEPAAGADVRPRLGTGSVALAATAMVFTTLVMVAVMTMTPVHLRDHGHGLGPVGVVIGVHVAFMYLPSPLSGWLADRYGRPPVLALAGLTLLSAGVVAAVAPGDSVVLLAVALALLGLGWNLGLVGGTAMLTDVTPAGERARTQGNVDLVVALGGATGGMGSGVVVAIGGFGLLGWCGAGLSLLLLPAVVRAARGPDATEEAAPSGHGRE
jgi:MFS family permease